ncbi:MAG: cupin domain-containing protein [Bacteroidales bacterium]
MKESVNLLDNAIWEDAPEYPDGTKKRVLREYKGTKTLLLKLPEGFHMESHSHITGEQHLILKGEYISAGSLYRAGSFQHFEAHEDHGPFESEKGALILVIWDSYSKNA